LANDTESIYDSAGLKLLIISGAPNEKNEGAYGYTWDGKHLRLLSKAPFNKAAGKR
jgi:hypothetical protein